MKKQSSWKRSLAPLVWMIGFVTVHNFVEDETLNLWQITVMTFLVCIWNRMTERQESQ